MISSKGVETTVLAMTATALGDQVSNTRTADSGLTRGVRPGDSEIVSPPGLWHTTSSDFDENGGEVG